MEFDTLGNVLENFEVGIDSINSIYPRATIKIDSENYAVLNYQSISSCTNFLCFVNKKQNP